MTNGVWGGSGSLLLVASILEVPHALLLCQLLPLPLFSAHAFFGILTREPRVCFTAFVEKLRTKVAEEKPSQGLLEVKEKPSLLFVQASRAFRLLHG
jgi:hypothetical protein